MNMKILPALLAAAFLSVGCQNGSYIESTAYQAESRSANQGQAQDVSLVENEDGTSVQILYGDRAYRFPYRLDLDNEVWPVQTETGDFTGRGKKELSIIWTTGYGTGVHIQDIFLLDLEAMEEIPVHEVAEDDYRFLKDRADALIQEGKDLESAWYGNYAEYQWLEDGELQFTVSAEQGADQLPEAFLGDVKVTFHYDGQGFVPDDKVEFIPE